VSLLTILVTFHTSSPHLLTFWDFRVFSPKKGVSLISWEEGVEDPEACSWKKIKFNHEPSRCSPRDPEDN
jgi:hypothetical protein